MKKGELQRERETERVRVSVIVVVTCVFFLCSGRLVVAEELY